MSKSEFGTLLKQMINGEIGFGDSFNEFEGNADVFAKLLAVAPAEISDELEQIYQLMVEARDATGFAVLGIFPKLCNPQLAVLEGKISDYIAEHYDIRLGDGIYHAGELAGDSLCPAWPSLGSPLTNNRFPYLLDTSASNYFSSRFWHGDNPPPGFLHVPAGGKVVFKGEYLKARYFAFHPNDIDTNNLETIIDVDIDPDPGSINPYREATPEGGVNRFTAQLLFIPKPENPQPNTSYVGEKANGGFNSAVFLLLRTTDSALGAMPPNSTGVKLPSVTIYDADGVQVAHYEEAEPYPEGSQPQVDTTQFAPLPIPDPRAHAWPEKLSTKSNWGLPYDILASADILYVVIPFSQHLGNVFVCRAKAFTTPNPKTEPVYVKGKDIRGYTVTIYNLWAGICNNAVVDHEIALDEDGYYTLVVSNKANRPDNANAENGMTWLDWGDYLDGQLTYRFLLSRDPMLQALKKAIDGGDAPEHVRPFVPKAKHVSKQDVESGDWRRHF